MFIGIHTNQGTGRAMPPIQWPCGVTVPGEGLSDRLLGMVMPNSMTQEEFPCEARLLGPQWASLLYAL